MIEAVDCPTEAEAQVKKQRWGLGMEAMEMGWVNERRSKSPLYTIYRCTTFKIIIISAIFWLVCFWWLSIVSARDPTSYFFNERKGYHRSYSLHREKDAFRFIESVNRTGISAPAASVHPSMCIGVATVKRPALEQYVRATIGSILEGLSDAERAEIFLIIFIAHTDPNAHPIYHEPWLTAVSNKVLTYNISQEEMTRLHKFENDDIPRNKSMHDYGYLLENCLDTSADWIAILEDDVIARAGWYNEAITSLQNIQEQAHEGSWLYLRMFYTEIFLSYVREHWHRYFGASLALFLFLFATLTLLRRRLPSLRQHLSNVDIRVLCCCCLPAFIALYFMAGYVTTHPPRPGVSLMPAFGCCSQGFIFPQDIVPSVIQRTKEAMYEYLYIDMLLERFADAKNLARFARFPSLLQHIGLKSSKGLGYDTNAGEIFNFGFETFHDWLHNRFITD